MIATDWKQTDGCHCGACDSTEATVVIVISADRGTFAEAMPVEFKIAEEWPDECKPQYIPEERESFDAPPNDASECGAFRARPLELESGYG